MNPALHGLAMTIGHLLQEKADKGFSYLMLCRNNVCFAPTTERYTSQHVAPLFAIRQG